MRRFLGRRWPFREALPEEARAALALAPGDHVIAGARTASGTWVAATGDALHVPGRRIPWTDVAHAQWVDDEQELRVQAVRDSFPVVRLHLPEPGSLPETVHERVMASIVMIRRVAVPGGSVRVVGRRAGSGEVSWQVVPEDGVDPDSPAVQAAADEAVRRLQTDLGVSG